LFRDVTALVAVSSLALKVRSILWTPFTTPFFGRQRDFHASGPDYGPHGGGRSGAPIPPIDPAFKRVAMYLFLGTKGGQNRIKIVRLLKEEPMNANKIREKLDLDYKTIQHHIRTLEENKMIVPSSSESAYGKMYFLSPYVERYIVVLEEIWARFGKRQK
jgi:DNA-binding transcriptional ArsR family regulator